MSNLSNTPFICRWKPSRLLLCGYLLVQLLSAVAVWLSGAPLWLKALVFLSCAGHSFWVLPRQILLSHPCAWRSLRHSTEGWHLWSAQEGWQSVQLQPDTMALPGVIIFRYRRLGQYGTRSVCIPHDALPESVHRRLRVYLRFSRYRWVVPE